MSDLDELKAEWFEFGRQNGKREAIELAIKRLENLDFESIVIREQRGTIQDGHGINAGSWRGAKTVVLVHLHKSDLIALIKGKQND